jgi:hypothetical protein
MARLRLSYGASTSTATRHSTSSLTEASHFDSRRRVTVGASLSTLHVYAMACIVVAARVTAMMFCVSASSLLLLIAVSLLRLPVDCNSDGNRSACCLALVVRASPAVIAMLLCVVFTLCTATAENSCCSSMQNQYQWCQLVAAVVLLRATRAVILVSSVMS